MRAATMHSLLSVSMLLLAGHFTLASSSQAGTFIGVCRWHTDSGEPDPLPGLMHPLAGAVSVMHIAGWVKQACLVLLQPVALPAGILEIIVVELGPKQPSNYLYRLKLDTGGQVELLFLKHPAVQLQTGGCLCPWALHTLALSHLLLYLLA